MSTDIETLFFYLLRAGLWESTSDNQNEIHNLSKIVDWDGIYRMAEEQSVVGLVASGLDLIKSISSDISVPQESSLQFVGMTLQLEQQNKAMNCFIAVLMEKLQKEGIKTILVKGQGVAQCYKKSLWRSCGDVDLLLDIHNFEKAKTILVPLAQNVENESFYAKHLGMTIDGWVVELHGSIRCGLSKRIDKVLDNLQYDCYNKGNVRVWKNAKSDVLLPAVNNDVLFIFTHFLNHFYKEGVGIRQICDWCRLLWSYKDEIDVELLKERLGEMKLISEWKAFGAFAVENLGMPKEAMPLYENSGKWKRKALLIKSFILEVGNFGHNRNNSYYNNYPFFIRKVISVIHRLRDALRHTQLFPIDSVRFFSNIVLVGFLNATRSNNNVEVST